MSSESGEKKAVTRKPPENHVLACPRCESTNTKFCYYNNYNLSQPRYFCKSCRRYWTHGGTLRNIPVGGGTRKSSAVKRSRHTLPSPLTHHQESDSQINDLNLNQTVYESLTPLVTNQNVEDAVVVGFSGVFGSGSGICGTGFELCPWDWSLGERVGGESGYYIESGLGDGDCYGGWSDLSISTPPNGDK